MKRKEVVLVLLVFCFVAFSLVNILSAHYLHFPISPVAISGRVLSGTVALYVAGGTNTILINSPEDTTYNFNVGEEYIIDLNVSADFVVDSWKYSLYDSRHEVWLEENTSFSPNITFSAGRWGNQLNVYARESGGGWYNANVNFYVSVPNSVPVIEPIDDVFVCEGDSGNLFYFNGSDVDEDPISAIIKPSHSLFYVGGVINHNLTLRRFEVSSPLLSKGDVGSYAETAIVFDDTGYSGDLGAQGDNFNITVIEVNNAPVVEDIGAQTIYLLGDDSSFNKLWEVSDIETDLGYGNLTYNISFVGEKMFDINSTTGVMNFTPTDNQNGMTFDITLCVNDSGIESVHENFSICSAKDYVSDSISVCDSFSLTITNDSRAPEILDYSPLEENFSVGGTTPTIFSVSVYDADGTIPDIDWYVNDVLMEENENISSDSYSYTFGCEVSGEYNVSVNVSDGLESVSRYWNVSVDYVACVSSGGGGSSGGGSRGGGGTLSGECREKWVCGDWGVCQNVKRSFDAKSISPEDYYDFKEICAQNKYDERFCGFQITECIDLNHCNNSVYKIPKSPEMQSCYFSENPSCIDGITNCHGGSCEVLVDCGGPCLPCPTCSDGKRNQGEEDVDCGGPCPWACEAESPFNMTRAVVIGLLVLLIGIFLIILIKLIKIVRYHFSKHKKGK